MSRLKKSWIDGYSGRRFFSLKDHRNGKPHMKALRSFNASVLKIRTEIGQKAVDTRVSRDKFKQLNRKANTTYFTAENDENLVHLIMREGNLNFEKDIQEGYWIFICQ